MRTLMCTVCRIVSSRGMHLLGLSKVAPRVLRLVPALRPARIGPLRWAGQHPTHPWAVRLMAEAAASGMASLAVQEAAPVAERTPYYKKRIEVFEQFHAREQARVEAARAANEQIKVIMPDGKERAAVKGATTPMDIAKEISASLAKKVVVADVDGQPWDLFRPLEHDCALKLFSFEEAEGRDVSGNGKEHSKQTCGRLGAMGPGSGCCTTLSGSWRRLRRSPAWRRSRHCRALPAARGHSVQIWQHRGPVYEPLVPSWAASVLYRLMRLLIRRRPGLLAQLGPHPGPSAGAGVWRGSDDRPGAGGGLLLRLLHGRPHAQRRGQDAH
jgi:hypothetical protein